MVAELVRASSGIVMLMVEGSNPGTSINIFELKNSEKLVESPKKIAKKLYVTNVRKNCFVKTMQPQFLE